jgi:MFS family permease
LAGIVAPLVAPLAARLGYKRVFVTLWTTRKLVVAGLLLTPMIAARYGAAGILRFVAADMAAFALCRAIAETGMYPWMREFVPDQVRGRFVAMDILLSTLFGFLAVSFAGYVIGRSAGLGGYMVLIAVGVLFGLAAAAAILLVPGGAPQHTAGSIRPDLRVTGATLHDRDFVRFLSGLGLMTLAIVPLNSFLTLFTRERLSLAQANVIFLQGAILVGGLLSSYLWGWAADRSGGKRVMLAGAIASVALPLLWLATPGGSAWTFPVALGVAFITGVCQPAWSIGSSRFLFMDVVPAGETAQYMAAFYAWAGITGATGAILGGRILQSVSNTLSQTGRGGDAYAILFVASAVMALAGLAVLRRARVRSSATSDYPTAVA